MELQKLKMKPLSDHDIYEKLHGKTNIVMYNELQNYKDIDELLTNDSAVILYENKPKVGHWVCLIKFMNDGIPTIEFFDSYGIFPDEEKKFISKRFLKESQQAYNKIAELLMNASDRYEIQFNNYKLQKWCKNVNTCGHHVISRIKMKDLNIDDYSKFLKRYKVDGLSPDDVVTIISEFL